VATGRIHPFLGKEGRGGRKEGGKERRGRKREGAVED